MRLMLTGRRGRGKSAVAKEVQARLRIASEQFAFGVRTELVDMVVHQTGRQRQDVWDDLTHHKAAYSVGLQWWGEYRRQTAGQDYWVRQLEQRLPRLNPRGLVIDDARYPNEAAWGQAHGFLVVRVVGPYRGDPTDARSDDHPSEAQIDGLPVDLECPNTGDPAALAAWVRGVLVPRLSAQEAGTAATTPPTL